MGINIIGTGMFVPDVIAGNEDFARIVDTSDEWITTRTGIKTRHITNGTLNFQMGAAAAKEAVEEAGIDPQEIDMIIA
ncbi:MAG: ketoacyl-ACP synthase III, partial [Massilimaliae sp.]|nr:ketoacyl-ACP synthase III [Massiliimalia sp.]